MELDGLTTSDSPQLAEASRTVLPFISSNLKALSTSLKIQTSRGNYLSSLNVQTEQVDFSDRDSLETVVNPSAPSPRRHEDVSGS